MTHPLNVVILAAGKGKRMHSDLPKVLHRLAGAPMVQHVLHAAKALKPAKLVVVVGHGKEAVQTALAHESDVLWAHQTEQLGTGHAVKMALPLLDQTGHTLVLYGDVPLIEASTLAAFVAHCGQGLGILTDTVANPTGYGRIVHDASGRIQGIVEHKDCTSEQLAIQTINTGMLLLPNARLAEALHALQNTNAQQEYYLTDLVAWAVAQGLPVTSYNVPHSWEAEGVNDKVQLAALERRHQFNLAQAFLKAGLMIRDTQRFDVRGTLTHSKDAEVDVNCIFEGTVHLGDGVMIGAHCVIKDATIAAGTHILPFTHIDGAVIGADNRIGPFARLRPDTVLADAVHVGNFVEIKKSTIGTHSKVNHLSYMGDADVGRNCNIGAGSITCNYDGVNKYRTTIGDAVFVGSNTMMVAPVTLEEGATIAAGTVLTETAPAHQLTIGRARASSHVWERPKKK